MDYCCCPRDMNENRKMRGKRSKELDRKEDMEEDMGEYRE